MTQDDDNSKGSDRLSRRAALARLGLGAAIAYSAPTVLHLDRSANAGIRPTPCPGKGPAKGKGAPWCRRQRRSRGDNNDSHRRRRSPRRSRRPNRRGRG